MLIEKETQLHFYYITYQMKINVNLHKIFIENVSLFTENYKLAYK